MCNNSRFESMPAQLGKSLVARSNWDYTGKEEQKGDLTGTRTRVQFRFAAHTLPVQTLPGTG
jgi:hypothetical protein